MRGAIRILADAVVRLSFLRVMHVLPIRCATCHRNMRSSKLSPPPAKTVLTATAAFDQAALPVSDCNQAVKGGDLIAKGARSRAVLEWTTGVKRFLLREELE